MVVIFIFAVTLVAAFYVNSVVGPAMINATASIPMNDTYNVTTAFQNTQASLNVFEASFLLIFVATLLSAVILALFIETHPIFIFFSFVMLVIEILVGAIFTNLFMEIASTPAFLPITNSMYTLVGTFQQFPLIISVFGILIIIALYAKFRTGGSGV